MTNVREIYNDQFVENDWAHYLVCRIDPYKDASENLAVLLHTGIKKDPLKSVVAFIKNQFVAKFPVAANALAPKKANVTKSELFNQLITFVEITLGHLCLKCNEPYFPYIEANRSDGEEVKCHLCSLPAHKECIKEEHLNSGCGIVYLCQHCLLHKGKHDILNIDPTEKPPPLPQKESGSESSEDSTSDSEDSDRQRKKKNHKKKTKTNKYQDESEIAEDDSHPPKKICRFYARGSCKHGVSGTRDGKCNFAHPPMCKPYQQYGRRGPNGCKGDCKLWHPKLCFKAIDFGECLNRECKFWHIKGTRRTNSPPSQLYQASYQSPTQNLPPQQTSTPSNNLSEHNFLDSIKSQIDQMVRCQQEAFQKQMSIHMSNLMKQMQQQMLAQPHRQMPVPVHQVQNPSHIPVQFMQPSQMMKPM